MAVFGSGTPVSKLVGEGFPPLLASCARMALAGLVLLPFAAHEEEPLFELTPRDRWIIFGVALVGNVLFSITMLYGMRLVSGVVGSVVMSTTPAVMATASVIFLRERMNAARILAILLALTGVLLINVFSGGSSEAPGWGALILGSVLVFGAVCCETTYTLLGRKGSQVMNPVKLACLSAWLAALLLVPFALWQGGNFDWGRPSGANWAALAWWGAGTMAAGSALWYSGIRKVPGHVAAGVMAVMPVSALVLSYILLGEQFRWAHLAGFGATFSGVLLIIREHMNAATQ